MIRRRRDQTTSGPGDTPVAVRTHIEDSAATPPNVVNVAMLLISGRGKRHPAYATLTEHITMGLELTTSFEVADPRFRKLALPNIHVEKLYTGCRWAEGPAWFAAGQAYAALVDFDVLI